jgi:uncharacterized metal-binding protein
MKNMITTCIIFFFMIFILFFVSQYIVLTCDKLLDVSVKIEENIVNDNWDESYMLSFELLNIYEGHIANLTLFLNHSDFDNIYSEIIKLSQYSKCKSKDEALSSIHVVKTLINQVKNLESITLGNIF